MLAELFALPLVVGAIVAIWLAVAVSSGDDTADGPETTTEPEPAKTTALDGYPECMNAVEARLRNPLSADFQTLSTETDRVPSGFTIRGFVTAENGYGVEQELRYQCDLDKRGRLIDAAVGR